MEVWLEIVQPVSLAWVSSGSNKNVFQLLFERKKPGIDGDLLCLLDNSLGSLPEVLTGVSPIYIMNVLFKVESRLNWLDTGWQAWD